MKVAVLKGGRSLERQVSLRSGARVEDALTSLGHEVVALDAGSDLVSRLKAERPDVAFVALHGTDGEDGTVQELLEILGLPYTGPGVPACRRATDKAAAKQDLRDGGVPTPDWVSFSQTAFSELGAGDALEEIEARLGFPLVIKPARGGSSLGVRFAAGRDDVPQALLTAFSYDDRVLFERHVAGRELSVGVIDGEVLPAVEIRPKEEDLYSYEARYEIGRTDFICPAELSDAEREAVAAATRGTWDALRCEGFARVDLMLGDEGPEVLGGGSRRRGRRPARRSPRRWPRRRSRVVEEAVAAVHRARRVMSGRPAQTVRRGRAGQDEVDGGQGHVHARRARRGRSRYATSGAAESRAPEAGSAGRVDRFAGKGRDRFRGHALEHPAVRVGVRGQVRSIEPLCPALGPGDLSRKRTRPGSWTATIGPRPCSVGP